MNKFSQFQELSNLSEKWKQANLRDVFLNDGERGKKMCLERVGLWVDYSKSLIDDEVLNLLIAMARESGLEEWCKRMFRGDKINFTEERSVLHTALRYQGNEELIVDGENVRDLVSKELIKMEEFTTKVRDGVWRGFSGKEITDVVNIGIGGSDLGPKVVTEALTPYHHERMKFYFVSNVDDSHLVKTVKNLNPETTLFIVASKSFTTQETMMNAFSARKWFLDSTNQSGDIKAHFVAVSTNLEAVKNFGIDEANSFGFWDWVGGRYSLWSPIGLIIMMAIGKDNFKEFLSGGYEMDEHFCNTPLEENLPVLLGLIGIWYRNFMNFSTYGIMPYDQYLEYLPAHLQQVDMESNGKSVNKEGLRINYETVPIVWGEPGTNSQHAFYQMLHQGTTIVPIDMILAVNSHNPLGDHHKVLMANCLAQAEALAFGRTYDESLAEMLANGVDEMKAKELAQHKTFVGNRPSIMIMMKQLTPRSLGSLLAMYEHKIFVQGIIWNINSFDQMGVELGKVLAKKFEKLLGDDVRDNPALEQIQKWRN